MKYSRIELISMASALHGAQSTSLTGSHVAVPTNHALLAGDMLKEIAQTLGEPVAIVCDWRSADPFPRFIEAENSAGESVSIPWHDRDDGLKELRLYAAPHHPTTEK